MKDVEVFFDTNILVYHLSDLTGAKETAANALIDHHLARRSAGISTQVMQECANVMFKTSAATETIHGVCERLLRPMLRVSVTAELIESAVDLKARWKFAFYDSLIIAAALACNAKTLYSEDLQHGQRIENLTIINPFL